MVHAPSPLLPLQGARHSQALPKRRLLHALVGWFASLKSLPFRKPLRFPNITTPPTSGDEVAVECGVKRRFRAPRNHLPTDDWQQRHWPAQFRASVLKVGGSTPLSPAGYADNERSGWPGDDAVNREQYAPPLPCSHLTVRGTHKRHQSGDSRAHSQRCFASRCWKPWVLLKAPTAFDIECPASWPRIPACPDIHLSRRPPLFNHPKTAV